VTAAMLLFACEISDFTNANSSEKGTVRNPEGRLFEE
jgi:hypothetical protein